MGIADKFFVPLFSVAMLVLENGGYIFAEEITMLVSIRTRRPGIVLQEQCTTERKGKYIIVIFLFMKILEMCGSRFSLLCSLYHVFW